MLWQSWDALSGERRSPSHRTKDDASVWRSFLRPRGLLSSAPRDRRADDPIWPDHTGCDYSSVSTPLEPRASEDRDRQAGPFLWGRASFPLRNGSVASVLGTVRCQWMRTEQDLRSP